MFWYTEQVEDSTKKLKGFFALFGAAFIYGTFGILIRYIAPMFGNNFQVVSRFFLAALFIFIFNLFRKKDMKLPTATLLKVLLLGIAFVSLVLLFTHSVINTKLANSVFLLYAGSITSSFLIGTFLFKEKVTVAKILAILLAFIGIAMYGNAILGLSVGIITGLASGIFDGIQNSLRRTLKGVDRNLVIQYSCISATLFAITVTAFSGEQIIKTVSITPIVITILYALLLLTLSNFLLYGFQHFDVNIGTVILSMELVFALLFGFFFFREVPTTRESIGGGFIFLASILAGVDTKELFRRLRNTK